MREESKKAIRKLALAVFWALPLVANAQDNRNYNTAIAEPFEAPGQSMNRQADGSFGVESIDPFTGALKIVVTDLVVPSNGGLDLTVTRNYQSFLRAPATGPGRAYQKGRTVMGGLGWDLHYGRLWPGSTYLSATSLPAANNQTGCRTTSVWPDTRFNPILELPDGSRQQFAIAPASADYAYISQDRWLLKCLPTSQSTGDGGAIVVSPDGVKYIYTFRHLVSNLPINGEFVQLASNSAFHVSKIEHPNGTSITINYVPKASSYYASLANVNHSEGGGQITFAYANQSSTGSTTTLLESFTHAGRTWVYQYTPAQVPNDGRTYLMHVVRPDGRKTDYAYNTRSNSFGPSVDGEFSLKKVTMPLGGEVDYTYTQKAFPTRENLPTPLPNYVVRTKIVRRFGGADQKTWYFNYRPSTTATQIVDFTDVKGPYSCETYEHHTKPSSGDVWRQGLLLVKSVLPVSSDPTGTGACGGTPLFRETNTWASQEVVPGPTNSSQGIFFAALALDTQVLVPRLSRRVVRLDGTDYATDFNEPDIYGNPQQVVEQGQTPTSVAGSISISRTTTYTYLNDATNWIIGRLKDETVSNAGTTYATPASPPTTTDYAITRTFHNGAHVGLVNRETRAGIATEFSYHTGSTDGGEISSIVDANGLAGVAANYTTSFSSYERGTAKQVSRPINSTVTQILKKEVYPSGMLEWEEDGELKRTNYQYNGVNLLTTVTTFKSNDSNTIITRVSTDTDETIDRGTYREVRKYDGFGSLIRTESIDKGVTPNVMIFQEFDYDAAGRVIKRYFPNSTSDGVAIGYDALNRVISETYPGGADVTYEYETNGRVRIIDERNLITWKYHRAFGDPMKAELILVQAPSGFTQTDGFQQTHIARDLIGNVVSISQGARNSGTGAIANPVTRTYKYNSKFLVFEEFNPETKVTRYTHDAAGNVTAKIVDAASATPLTTSYTLDRLYRPDLVSFPGTTGTVDYDFYKNDLPKSVTRGNAIWNYFYDDNNNLETERLTLAAPAFSPARLYEYVFQYNDKDALKAITYPSLLKVDYAPDAFGRPKRVDAFQDGVATTAFASSVVFHPNGQLNSVTLGNGVTTTYTQDSRLRPEDFKATATINGALAVLVNRRHGYDDASNVTSINDLTPANKDKSMSYDGLHRLRASTGPWGTGAITYHDNDNINTMVFNGTPDVAAYSVTMGYDAANRLSGVMGTIERIEYTYDKYGNVTNNGELNGKFTFDDDSLLREVRGPLDQLKLEYLYDGNRRVVREYDTTTQSTRYKMTAQSGSMFFEEDIENAYTKDHVFVNGTLLSTRMRCTSSADSDSDGISNCLEARLGMLRTSNDANFDADEDGLTNIVEVQQGTDIYQADTDSDGLGDNYEVTNGLVANVADSNLDTDGDGLSNLAEFQLGTRPNNSDSDNDGIPDNTDPKPMFNPAWLVPIFEILLGS